MSKFCYGIKEAEQVVVLSTTTLTSSSIRSRKRNNKATATTTTSSWIADQQNYDNENGIQKFDHIINKNHNKNNNDDLNLYSGR